MAGSNLSTILYNLLSKLTTGGTGTSGANSKRWSSVTMYASDFSANRSLQVFTGANRVRSTQMAMEPGRAAMAAPIAVSSWKTAGELESRGSTVLEFLISGRGNTPLLASMAAFNAGRFNHKLLVLKYLCTVMSWNLSSSSLGHCADSRNRSLPSLSLHKCPPFLSDSVRSATSMHIGAPLLAKYDRMFMSIVAPKLSELETNMYLTPSATRASSLPVPAKAAYKSPWPGGHHSRSGAAGQEAGSRVLASTLGALFCINSMLGSLASSGYLAKKALVSSEVEKLFIIMNFRGVLSSLRMCITCLAMKSRKVSSPFTWSRDFAFSSPIPVPRPPFSFSTRVSPKRVLSPSSAFGSSASLGKLSTASMVSSGIMPVLPSTRSLYTARKALENASDRPASAIFFLKSSADIL
mmetsp:Transcript_64899/g.107690  ORF Transcript_64899/g.107690 Transcript_64899/m.107690 type:complete len:409 (-) Transcript_64899:23-1249(-)